MNSKVKLADVARSAGVAVGTASRVLNNRTDVNPEARARVLEAVAKLNYRPLRRRNQRNSLTGNGNREKEVRNIGVVFLGMAESLVNVPVLGEILQGIESGISRVQGNLLFANLPDANLVPSFLKHNQVEGLIVKTSQYGHLPSPEENPLMNHILRYPIVWVWARPDGAVGDLCSFNHQTAAMLAARHLKEKGHHRVAFFNPKMGKSSLEHMKTEFLAACQAHELDCTALEVAPRRGRAWPEPALNSAEEVLPLVAAWKKMPAETRPTACFVPADNIAVHLYGAMERNGLIPGRDLSIISCNNEKSLSKAMKPRLSTIEVHAQEIGRKAVRQLVWRIANVGYQKDQTLLFEPILRPRESVADLS